MAAAAVRIRERFTEYYSSDALSADRLLDIFLPLMWEQIFFAGVALLSSWMLSVEGEAAVSAVNMINVCNFLFTSVCVAVATGGTVVISQYVGAKNFEMSARTMQQTISAGTFLAIVIAGLLLIFQRDVVHFLLSGAPDDVMNYALAYFFGACVSLPFYAFYQNFAGCMRGWGRTKTALTLAIVVNCLELAFTALFVLGYGYSVMGIALAMIISRGLGCVFVVLYIFRHRRELDIAFRDFFIPNKSILRGIALIALPVAMEQVFFSGGKALSQRFIASYGTTHMVANSVFNIVSGLYNTPQMALSTTTLTVVGMCLGQKRVDLANSYIHKLRKATQWVLITMSVLFVPVSIGVTYGYGLSPEARNLAYISFLICYVGSPLLWARSFMVPSGLRAGGDALYTSVVALSSMWGVRVALSYVFTKIFSLGVIGVVLAMVIEWGARGLLFSLRLRGDKWYRHNVIER